MNIEENSIGGAIRTAGNRLGHFHTGECDRNVPGKGRIPWVEIAEALHDIGYEGAAVMEPLFYKEEKLDRTSGSGAIFSKTQTKQVWTKQLHKHCHFQDTF